MAESGEKPIEQLKRGDKVLARNEKTGKQSYHQVQQTFATPNDELYNLTLTGSSGKPETLGVTGNHPFWKKDKGWTESDLLKVGDLVQAKDGGWLKVESLTPRVERATGYNLEVEGDHSYFVGDSGAWVHNQTKCFTSTDPLVGELATEIEARYPGHVVGVNVPVRDASGNLVTELDIVLRNAVIQVKSGGGKGLSAQVLKTEATTGLPTIGYGPILKPSVVKGVQQAGGLVTRDKKLLIELVRP